ncbi:cell wall protein PhiA [Massariosphaeria phaeospora]|uniref:Cell wall protein PhiA n=1 Tax=Massariosphaeria phaeospora TaxID=100035 RepID=A0A7C8M3F5_9PLEO|nr:cell wall protein PhiA [Massariosphaeria phaeospora]
MQFKTAILAFTLAFTANGLPASTAAAADSTFGVIAIRSGSLVQNAGFQAARSSLFVNLASQNASCEDESNYATFYIEDEELHLYTVSGLTQTVFVDRSGMGMGKVGYVNCTTQLGRNSETKGWAVGYGGNLEFQGIGFQACPGSIDGGWSLWLQGVEKPGFNEGCLGVSTNVLTTDEPIGCDYTT